MTEYSLLPLSFADVALSLVAVQQATARLFSVHNYVCFYFWKFVICFIVVKLWQYD